jgi:hypothetical protein
LAGLADLIGFGGMALNGGLAGLIGFGKPGINYSVTPIGFFQYGNYIY